MDLAFLEKSLSRVRAIFVLWSNEAWLTQSPLPGLSPISYKNGVQTTLLRRMANFTPVKPGNPSLDGIPSIVLRALRATTE